MVERASINFGDADFDVSGFTPAKPAPAAPLAAVRKVAERAKFPSREPERKRPEREPRRYRTGRNASFNIKADPTVIARFYAISDASDEVLGQTLERAVAALENEIAEAGRGGQG